jgi:hypothetical protein
VDLESSWSYYNLHPTKLIVPIFGFDFNLTLESAFLGKEGLELNSVSGQKKTDHTTKG